MTKQAFLSELRKGLAGLPADDVEERLAFYAEMIDDRMEDGVSEETAVGELGAVDTLAAQIIADVPLTKLVRQKLRTGRRSAWEIVLLILGAPLWLPLLLAALAVVLALVVSLWAVLVSLWAVFAACAAGGLACVLGGAVLALRGSVVTGLAALGAGLVCAGVSVLLFFGCRAAAKGALFLTKKLALGIKRSLVGKGGAA